MQIAAINRFLDDIEQLPFKHHSGRDDDPDVRFEANLANRLNPCWAPIGKQASELIAMLASATLLNKGCFQGLE